MAVLCGFMLWQMPLGEPWVNASYDNLFRFGARAVTNRVTLILMDNEAYDQFHQSPRPALGPRTARPVVEPAGG